MATPRAGRPPRCRPSFPPPPRCRRRPPRSRLASPRRPPASLEKAADEAHEYPSLRPLDESQEEDPYPDEVISCSFPRPIVIASLFVYLLNADALVHGREMWCWDGGGRPQFRPDWVRADDACLQDRVPEMAGWDGVYSSRDVEPLCRARQCRISDAEARPEINFK
ncbi:hypothetical protein BRADI_5g20751v3 [Brachypodium distachyon]|uniref:Uncharacterized protein n=1 Tax=Brachypodium distachyon TaxID=15368 RepID=A0A2K2CID5_BRADI|nr:hypothetical protein BRADI_5g20751v3 [Brachypodium distachyon]